jgi:putative DNA primase/helicase
MSPANIIARSTPVETAKKFREQKHPNMIKYQADWLDWNGSCYEMIEDDAIESELLVWLEACKEMAEYEVLDEAGNPTGKKKYRPEKFNPKPSDVASVNVTLARWYHVKQGKMKPPFFLDGGTGAHVGLDPANLISCQNGLLDVTTRKMYPPTPQFFTRTALPISYDETAECPLFRTFLFEVLDDDALFALMQQWFGHLITTDVTIQKLLYLQGVPRSGKGTIGRVLDALVGEDNVASHKLKDVATNFDLESMIGKSLLKVSEVHSGTQQIFGDAISTLNGITGEDRQHIQRKFKGSLDMALKLHVVLMGNGYPDFGEHAAAFATRVDVIPFRITFAGREDDTLTKKLLAELPGILNFALEGLADLRETRKFKIVAASEEAKRQMLNSGNPVRAFVADLCELGPWETDKRELFSASVQYCLDIKAFPLSEPIFFKKLKEAFPGLQNTRPRVEGGRENFIAGIRLRDAGPPTTATFWLDMEKVELAEMLGDPLDVSAAALIDPITGKPVEAIENEFSGSSE